MSTSLRAREPLRFDLHYVLTPSGIDKFVAQNASEPPESFQVSVDLSLLDADLRKRAFHVYQRLEQQRLAQEDDAMWETLPPAHERFPQLPTETTDPEVVVTAWEGRFAGFDAAVAKEAERTRIEQAVVEGKRAAFRGEMARWIREQGSERLKLALERDYKIHTLYVRERAAQEFPGFILDPNSKSRWRERTNPSLGALKLERFALACQARISTLYKIRVVWLLKDEAGEDAKREAVAVPEYLGFYTLLADPTEHTGGDEIPL